MGLHGKWELYEETEVSDNKYGNSIFVSALVLVVACFSPELYLKNTRHQR